MSYYIFNTNNVCSSICDFEPNSEDLASRGEFYIKDDGSYSVGDSYSTAEKCIVKASVDYSSAARKLRNTMRSSIDPFVLVTSTYNDVLVTDEQKADLIADSLLLAKWPSEAGWPLIYIPTLSSTFESFCGEYTWSYVDAAGDTQTSSTKSST